MGGQIGDIYRVNCAPCKKLSAGILPSCRQCCCQLIFGLSLGHGRETWRGTFTCALATWHWPITTPRVLVLRRSVTSDPFATPWTIAHQAPLSIGILQARIVEWVAMPSSRGSSQPRDWTQVSCIAGRFFYHLSHQGNPPFPRWV